MNGEGSCGAKVRRPDVADAGRRSRWQGERLPRGRNYPGRGGIVHRGADGSCGNGLLPCALGIFGGGQVVILVGRPACGFCRSLWFRVARSVRFDPVKLRLDQRICPVAVSLRQSRYNQPSSGPPEGGGGASGF